MLTCTAFYLTFDNIMETFPQSKGTYRGLCTSKLICKFIEDSQSADNLLFYSHVVS